MPNSGKRFDALRVVYIHDADCAYIYVKILDSLNSEPDVYFFLATFFGRY